MIKTMQLKIIIIIYKKNGNKNSKWDRIKYDYQDINLNFNNNLKYWW